jgi:hypothetical protein
MMHKDECATLRGKISEKYLKSLNKHEIKREFICFAYKIKIYFFLKHQLFYFTSAYATRENIASGVHSVKYISILHAKQTNVLYLNSHYLKQKTNKILPQF